MNDLNKVIASRFQELLDKEGLTQEAFAKKVGLSRGHISKVLTARVAPSGAMLIKLANAGYDVTWLLCGEKSGLANWSKEKELLEFHIKRLEEMIQNLMKK
tara:strand:+ start:34 stop:336 length:303 start_codon:yes stop_codon:yes gene_type:complete